MSIESDDNKEENLSYAEITPFLDRICRSPIIDEESQHMLSSVMKKVEDLQISKRKQTSIRDFFE